MSLALVHVLAVLAAAAPEPGPRPAADAPAVRERADAAPAGVAFQLGEDRAGRCVLEPRALPPATFACTALDGARASVPGLDLRAVGLEVEGGRPVLVLVLAPQPGGPGEGAAALARFCAAAREAGTRAEGGDASGDSPAGPLLKRVWAARHAFEPGKGTVRFRSIQRLRRGGETIGWVEYWIGARTNGDRYLLSRTVNVTVQGAAARPRCVDASQVEDADGAGVLLSGAYAHFTDGDVRYRTRLSRSGEHTYEVDGQAGEKPLHGRIETREGIATALVRMSLFRESTGYGPEEPVHQEAYMPGRDPERAVQVEIRKDPARPRGIAWQAGKRTVGVVTADGLLEWAEQEGNPPVRFDTVFRWGSP